MKKAVFTFLMLVLVTGLYAQNESLKVENDNSTVKFKLKKNAKPDIYVDGKKFDFDLELLDQDKIASVNVVKGDEALKTHNAPNGVVFVITKKKNEVLFKEDSSKDPIMIINGKISSKMDAEKLSPNDIESVNVLKGEQAMSLYNSPNGAIIITTKKK